MVFFFTYYNCCWILQVAASKRRAAYLSMDRDRSTDHNLTGHGGGRLHAAFLPLVERCVLLFEIPGVSNAKAVRFLFCFYVQIRIAGTYVQFIRCRTTLYQNTLSSARILDSPDKLPNQTRSACPLLPMPEPTPLQSSPPKIPSAETELAESRRK